MSTGALKPPIALVMGVANHRSIAWACVEAFRKLDFDVVLSYQNDRFLPAVEKMIGQDPRIQSLPCDVTTDLPLLFQQRIPELYQGRSIDAIVHSIAFAPFDAPSFSQFSQEDFQKAHHISSYSLIETARMAKPLMSSSSSLTALTHLGSTRTVDNYHLMGPAKASLEASVRALASEMGHDDTTTPPSSIRVNAVSAGPLRTLSAKGIPAFMELYQKVQQKSPLRRNVLPQEVANTVTFLATEGTGITGQVIYVDCGFNTVVPI